MTTFESVVNISEGRDRHVLRLLENAGGAALLDVHVDPDHHRSVFTMAGPLDLVEGAVRDVASLAVKLVDIREHRGLHPRLGAVDVVPFVPLEIQHQSPTRIRKPAAGCERLLRPWTHLSVAPSLEPAVRARDSFSEWMASALNVPCFLYGPLPANGFRTLPEIRRSAFSSLPPDFGPPEPHPTAGACAVGARPPLIAYNVWISGTDLDRARSVAASIRCPAVRALAFPMGTGSGAMQVSCNLVDPLTIGPAEVHDRIASLVEDHGGSVDRCELVGLLPAAVIEAIPPNRWAELDLAPGSTIEARMQERGVLIA